MILQIVGADELGKPIHFQFLIQKQIAAFVEQSKLFIEDRIVCRDGDQDLDLLIDVCNKFVESDVFADHTFQSNLLRPSEEHLTKVGMPHHYLRHIRVRAVVILRSTLPVCRTTCSDDPLSQMLLNHLP